MESHYYEVDVRWSRERKGILCSPELNAKSTVGAGCIEVATPPEFPKGIPGIWSPEHLYTASVSSCYLTTFLAIADNSALEFVEFSCQSKGKLEKQDGKFMMSEVILQPVLTVTNEKDVEKGYRILHKTEGSCLITNSIRTKVTVDPLVKLASHVEKQQAL